MGNKINTLIGQDISISGEIKYEGIIHIEAAVSGSLVAVKNKDSKLYINKTSVIKGSVDALDVAINGTIHGNVYACGLIQLGSDAIVKGDVFYKSIEMEVGAKIDGRMVVCDSDEQIKLYKLDIESSKNSTTIND